MISMRLYPLIIAFAVFLAVPAAQATSFNMKKLPPLENPALMAQGDFESKTRLVEETPYKDEALQYRVRLPIDWERIDTQASGQDKGGLSRSVINRIAEFTSPAKLQRRSFFTVESQELTYEIGARNWFLNYFQDTGFTLEGVSQGESDNEVVEATYFEVRGDISYHVRIKTIVNGSRIIIARFYVPVRPSNEAAVIKAQEEDLQMQAQSIASFKLTGTKLEQIEERSTHGFLDQTYFDYPVSWKLIAPKVVNVERMRAMVFNPGVAGKMHGQINVHITSRYIDTTLGKEVKLYMDKLNIPDYKVGGVIERLDLPVHENVEQAQTEIYRMEPVKNYMQHYELWVTLMQTEGFYYIITLLTPAREADFYQWARNARAYEIIVKTTRQFDPSIDQYQYAD